MFICYLVVTTTILQGLSLADPLQFDNVDEFESDDEPKFEISKKSFGPRYMLET